MVRVTTHTGIVEGYMQNGIATFLAVPYAAPISTANRFAAPRPPTPWAGIRQCIRPGAVCPQIPTYGPVGRNATSSLAAGEDFLTLNIRTPALSGRAPVLVWLHGGGYAMGSANEPQFQTGAFARSGIVEVCANYRLGALGFLPMGAACPTNRGLLDIISALEWVRDQIALFGGDPERVVLAGRSAGGFAVSTLLAMPAAHGLFARALIQSGATSAVLSPHDGQRTTRRFMEALGQPDPAELEGMDIGRMLHAQRSICEESYEQHDFGRDGSVTMVGIPFQPVIDGTTLPDHPETLARQGRMARVPVMIGTTSAEYMTHSTAHPDLASWAQVIALLAACRVGVPCEGVRL
ncbi:hypothetical protein B0W47_14105 [Komagataeibacter nataicola]|uniref:Carboxylic ester hydrolase n=1 Tax=Komagataeibacter nataicola TaxID=265960 RepID=A0A9N7CSP2_9PROT|nr:carboxylesterase family protein [Komagataeibacter nataicola]AQU88401.1 hypothetical protein B0W47_14105 [Komagataeibacter nataicola]